MNKTSIIAKTIKKLSFWVPGPVIPLDKIDIEIPEIVGALQKSKIKKVVYNNEFDIVFIEYKHYIENIPELKKINLESIHPGDDSLNLIFKVDKQKAKELEKYYEKK